MEKFFMKNINYYIIINVKKMEINKKKINLKNLFFI